MANMSYCRFRNTLGDLRDCYHSMPHRLGDGDVDERDARRDLIELCIEIAREYGATHEGSEELNGEVRDESEWEDDDAEEE